MILLSMKPYDTFKHETITLTIHDFKNLTKIRKLIMNININIYIYAYILKTFISELKPYKLYMKKIIL